MIKIKYGDLYEKIPDEKLILFRNKLTGQIYRERNQYLYSEEDSFVCLVTFYKVYKFLWFKWETELVSFESYCNENSFNLQLPFKDFDEISSIILYHCEKLHPELNFNIRLHDLPEINLGENKNVHN